jgi:hypothetical protein
MLPARRRLIESADDLVEEQVMGSKLIELLLASFGKGMAAVSQRRP